MSDSAQTPVVTTQWDVGRNPLGDAVADIREALSRPGVIVMLARRSIRAQYHGMWLGLLWISLTTAAWVAGIGILWGEIFAVEGSDHINYVSIGIPTWGVLNMIMLSGGSVFAQNASLFKQIPTPYSVFAFTAVLLTMITTAFRFVAPCVALVFFALNGQLTTITPLGVLLALLGLVLIFITGFGVALFLGTLAARFADIRELTSAAMMFAFFVTPTFWEASRLENSPIRVFVDINPFYHFLETVRAPLLEGVGSHLQVHFAVAAACAAAANAAGFLIFSQFRKRLPYWC